VPIYGKDGIIVFLGGDIPTTQAYVGGAALAEFSDITIYDISTGNYYQQTATGLAIPLGRIQFCATGAAAADNSSFEMSVSSEREIGLLLIISADSYTEAVETELLIRTISPQTRP
jgi:hypothetical protein